MIKIIVNSDFTENYATNLTKGILAYSHKTGQPWALCRMPISFKKEQGLDGVVRWAKEWNADTVWSAERCRGFKDTLAAQDADDVSVFNKESIDTPWHYDMHSLVGWLRQLPPSNGIDGMRRHSRQQDNRGVPDCGAARAERHSCPRR